MKITGAILAGGASRRMGSDKALLKAGERPLLELCSGVLSRIADTVVIACGPELREGYRFLGLPQLPDHYPGLGPLAGLHAALTASPTEWTAVLACDLPLVPEALLRRMSEFAAAEAGLQAVIPAGEDGRVQPLAGLYHRSVLPRLTAALENGQLRVMDWLAGITVRYFRESDYPGDRQAFAAALLNVNTPEDFAAARRRLEEAGH
ncbi:molybdenum cofactor guanylyltransferase [Paenibacillus tengchongensis]|uniref:molybdenum cofactor guanylyltransferase n=1 Tax=Paenibacillus tengchongensis TaxID=2608684 RepID=UPI0016527FB5|nr:molybdenum cofactor guanylyltransferase [Paenibacillus tengchongensis]